MNDPAELLFLRILLLAVVLGFVLLAALTMRGGLGRASPARSGREVTGARLVLVVSSHTGIRPGTEFPLAGEMSIGRDGSNSIVLSDSSVSGQHASVTRTGSGWRLIDLGSTNGTAVNGRRVDGRGRMLSTGDQVVLGAVVFRFQA